MSEAPRFERAGSIARFAPPALFLLAAGCAKPAAETPPAARSDVAAEAPAPSSEAAKADELEQQAKENQDRFQEIQASDMTPEQKAQAASALVDEQQKAIQESDSSGSSGDGGPN